MKKSLILLLLSLFCLSARNLAGLGDALESRRKILSERGKRFEQLGLFQLAREQYQWMLTLDPKNKTIKNKLQTIAKEESEVRYKNALTASKAGAQQFALWELDRALLADPHHGNARRLMAQLKRETKLSKEVQAIVSRYYEKGVQHYEKDEWNLALEYFVKVVNMHPHHKGARRYIEKIGQNMDVTQ